MGVVSACSMKKACLMPRMEHRVSSATSFDRAMGMNYKRSNLFRCLRSKLRASTEVGQVSEANSVTCSWSAVWS